MRQVSEEDLAVLRRAASQWLRENQERPYAAMVLKALAATNAETRTGAEAEAAGRAEYERVTRKEESR